MAPSRAPSASLLRSLQSLSVDTSLRRHSFALHTSAVNLKDAQKEKPKAQKAPAEPALAASAPAQQPDQNTAAGMKSSFYKDPNPATVHVPRLERRLMRQGIHPIGSRRRRAALAQSSNIPFDQMPFQCFQEARKILIADRLEKLQKIEVERARIARVKETDPDSYPGGDAYKQKRLRSMEAELERLKILADVNDPVTKKRYEDGKGDMSKPIYRYYAEKEWNSYRRKVLVQRIHQMKTVPDVVPACNPILEPTLYFDRKRVHPGDFVLSATSENAPSITLQMFEKGERLVTIAVVDSDVPNLETDSFDVRCHFLATNVKITPTEPRVSLGLQAPKFDVLLPWTAPTAQKGSPYHRISIVVLQQKDNIPIDKEVAMKKAQREGFSVRGLMSRHMLTPVAATLFRTQWDEHMKGVMERAGVPGADVELKRKKVEPLPYKRRTARMRG